jgi:L,D-transpeptidase YcbB
MRDLLARWLGRLRFDLAACLLLAAGAVQADPHASLLRDALGDAAKPRRADALPLSFELRALYAARDHRPLWLDNDGQPTLQARRMVDALLSAGQRGLDAADYPLAALPQSRDRLDPAGVQFDIALTTQAMRFAQHLQRGRVDPRRVGLLLDAGATLDLARVVAGLADADDTTAALDALEPPFPSYRRLRHALARYLELTAQADTVDLPPLPGPVLEPGSGYAGTAVLARRLAQLGDLPSDAVPAFEGPSARYDGLLVAAVERFQRRHGLAVDGRIGAQTRDALVTPMHARVEQIRLAMERWRWAPVDLARPPIVVNIPEFRLRAVGDDGRVGFETDVVVGRSFQRQTPIFADQLRTVVFQPSWHVPASIVRRDIVPRLERDADYLTRNHYVIVGRDTQRVDASVIDDLRRGRLALRQTPGPHNSLGAVKFLFPNDHSVYLHDTPATELFNRPRRDFSSGCIRLRDPGGLAEWVLRNRTDWPPERIRAAMAGGRQDLAVAVVPPIPVYLVYVTAVAAEAGEVRFLADIYGHDATLLRALQGR